MLPAPLVPLEAFQQFIVWQLVTATPKPDKVSVHPHTLRPHDAHDPACWLSAERAATIATAAGKSFGVGFVLADTDPFFFVDLDHQLQPDGTWTTFAQQVCALFPGAAVEVSQSGEGLHIIGTGTPPPHGTKDADYRIELYHRKRFIALTGWNATGDAATRHDAALVQLVQRIPGFAPKVVENVGDFLGPREDWRGPVDDEDLLRRALQSTSARAAFGGGASFADLWEARQDTLARAYPSPSGDTWDRNSADAALAQHLAFWTGCDAPRIERLMRQSKLAREKWDRHVTYLCGLTIPKACGMQKEVLQDKEPNLPTGVTRVDAAPGSAVPARVTGSAFVSVEHQVTLFTGCIYIADQHQVLIPGGQCVKPENFKAWYGGAIYNLDTANLKVTRDAWEAFIQSNALRAPRAHTTVFRPLAAPGSLITLPDGVVAANTWWPLQVPRIAGDYSPFTRLLERLLPVPRDRDILLAYLAACVQRQGIKFQWAPLIQGVEGNGKTILSKCVAEAIGQRYVHWPHASKLTAQFNSWMVGHTLYCVEDIYTPAMKEEVFENLKPMITGDALEIEAKRVDQVTTEVCGNFILNSNHKDGLRKTRNDRRIAPFFTAQQTERQVREQRTAAYLIDMFDWLKGRNRYAGQPPGFAVVSEMLWTYPIPPDLDPARGFRAPDTSSTEEAIGASLGSVEQHILESIECDEPGFAGGWVSSIALGRLFERIKRNIAPNSRRKIMQDLGYDWHPALPDGRVPEVIATDGGKPKLFIRQGHPMLALQSPAEISRHYQAAQLPKLPGP
jgi:hypothetical protein